jgi:hypothetical protein
MNTTKATSEAIKNLGPRTYHRYDKAKLFARKMRLHAARIREWGCKQPGKRNDIPRRVLNAICWGCGDEHNRRMIAKYEEAAKAAERFCTSRSR